MNVREVIEALQQLNQEAPCYLETGELIEGITIDDGDVLFVSEPE